MKKREIIKGCIKLHSNQSVIQRIEEYLIDSIDNELNDDKIIAYSRVLARLRLGGFSE